MYHRSLNNRTGLGHGIVANRAGLGATGATIAQAARRADRLEKQASESPEPKPVLEKPKA